MKKGYLGVTGREENYSTRGTRVTAHHASSSTTSERTNIEKKNGWRKVRGEKSEDEKDRSIAALLLRKGKNKWTL